MPVQEMGIKRKGGNANEGEEKASAKRQRVSRACDQCRIAREKCDGIQPVCFTCASSNRECSYTANPKKRGIQPGYIRSLELTLAWLFSNIAESEPALLRLLAQEGPSCVLLEKDAAESNKLHKRWRKSKFCKETERLLSGADPSSGIDKSTPDSDEDDIDTSPVDTNHVPIDSGQLAKALDNPFDSNSELQKRGMPQHYGKSSNQPRSVGSQSACHVFGQLETQLPPDVWNLLDVYFAYTHSWLPICEKHDILKTSYSYPEDGLTLEADANGSGDHAELWSILAYASIQDTTKDSGDPHREANESSCATRFYDIARHLIPYERGILEVGHIKAMLILALSDLDQRRIASAWLLLGHAARALTLLQATHEPGDASTVDSRFVHTFAGCFVLETIVSAQLQRRPYLQASDMKKIGTLREDGLEEWHPWIEYPSSGLRNNASQPSSRMPLHSLSAFNCLVDISGILNDAIQSSGWLQRSTHSALADRSKYWRDCLPKNFRYIYDSSISAPSTPPAALLQFIYNSVQVLGHRNLYQSSKVNLSNSLNQVNRVFGVGHSPPIIRSLLEIISRCVTPENERLDVSNFVRYDAIHLNDSQPSSVRPSTSNRNLPTPESLYTPFNSSILPTDNAGSALGRQHQDSIFLQELLPDMNASETRRGQQPQYPKLPSQIQDAVTGSSLYQSAYAEPSRTSHDSMNTLDLESFFDELASLDGAERLDNQPQFMQNLGFAPDADMTDVLASNYVSNYGSYPQVQPFVPPGNLLQNSSNENFLFEGG